jgi:16S rRNA C967 or C1407 C5-methylase (RsmB/RsmF family)/NOL1/NOP2/fmu family ribosome biogenesis protein
MNSELPAAFLARMREQLHTEAAYDAFLRTYEREAFRGLRVNTLKITKDEFEKISPFSLRPVPWEENGFYVTEEKIGRHPYHFAGLYYSQEPSAMSVAPLLDVRAGERVLDLCAAPGGKSTQLAQALGGKGLLVSNEINGGRASVLSQNIERLGVKNGVVLNAAPSFLSARFEGYFDKILVDAPCSGEGMFKKNEKEAVENWSEENVALCAVRQTEILRSAAAMLAAGGRLVYSTCTFSPEEDEGQIASFLGTMPEFELVKEEKLYPHEVEGEGHFYAVLQKTGGVARTAVSAPKSNITKKEGELFSAFRKENLAGDLPRGILYKAGNILYLLPEEIFTLEKLPVLRAGIRLGEFLKERFEPAHSLAMCLKAEEVNRVVRLSLSESEKYLRGETVEADVANGWCLVCVDNYPLGWGKATGGTVKNHYPKGLRLVK